MKTPWGRYGEEERTKPVVLKRDRSKSNIISLHHSYFYLSVKPALRPKPRTERPCYCKVHRVAVDDDNERQGVRVLPA